jgi:type IV secretory pathway TrbD component
MSDLRKTPLYRALYRPQLLLGGDRNLMIVVLFSAALLTVVSMNTVSIVLGLFILVVGVYSLRKAAKADPLMRQVYLRHIKYSGYYAPFSRPWRISKSKRVY